MYVHKYIYKLDIAWRMTDQVRQDERALRGDSPAVGRG